MRPVGCDWHPDQCLPLSSTGHSGFRREFGGAALYHAAAMAADSDRHDDPVRVDHHCNDLFDMILTLSGGRTIAGTATCYVQALLPTEEHRVAKANPEVSYCRQWSTWAG